MIERPGYVDFHVDIKRPFAYQTSRWIREVRDLTGVPTLFIPDGQCLFGPVLVDPPAGEAAVRLWDAVVALNGVPAPL